MKMRKTIGVAFAVAAVAAIGAYLYSIYGGTEELPEGEITVFEKYSQIEKILSTLEDEEPLVYANGEITAIKEDAEMSTEAADSGSVPGQAAAKDREHSDTYIQVEGVDEADIIKTDGNYIYYTSRIGYDIVIAKVDGDKVKEVALIPEEEIGVSADDLFLTGGRLIIVGSEFTDQEKIYDYARPQVTAACIYDVSDPQKPEQIGKYRQSGVYVSSRVTDGYLYLITNDYLNRGEKRIVPSAGADEGYAKLEADHICCFPEPARKAYAVIGSVKVDSKKGHIKSETRAVLGASDDLYCSGSSLYLTDFRAGFMGARENADERTYIIKAEISKGKIDFVKQGSIRGSVYNQFAMDEKDGYFRVATTAYVKGKDVNYLYVMDEDLKVVGKVRGFAAGEQIKAVRFIGDMAYVITYEQTDPLFVIDLKDPTAPQMLGSVKITGFSSLLVPEGENMLVGIGMSTSEEEFGEVEDGVKIALFDISDPAKPKVLDSKTYKNYSSAVQYDHRALTVNSAEGWYAVPYEDYDNDRGGVIQFKVADGKLKEAGKYESTCGIERCLYIDDYLYGLEACGDQIDAWKIGSSKER